MCIFDVGILLFFGLFIGQSNDFLGDMIFLCLGDIIQINYNDDQDLSGDFNMVILVGIGYSIFICIFIIIGLDMVVIKNDFCIFDDGNVIYGFYVYMGGIFSGDVLFFNDGNLQINFNGGVLVVFYFVLIIFDVLFMGVLVEYEGILVGDCVSFSVDQEFVVVYFNEIIIIELSLNGCQGSFWV